MPGAAARGTFAACSHGAYTASIEARLLPSVRFMNLRPCLHRAAGAPAAILVLVLSAASTASLASGCGSHAASPTPDGGSPSPAGTGGGGGSELGMGGATGQGGAGAGGAADAGTPPDCPPSWTPSAACGGPASPGGAAPDFGPNVLVFDPSMPASDIQSKLSQVYTQQDAAQFGTGRYAYFFKPGQYALDVQVGFYTQVLGLGTSPDDVTITGAVRAKADWLGNNNATCNFWRGAENFAVVPSPDIDSGVDVWAVSQGTAIRRAHVLGTLVLDDNGGWSSGGFIADSRIDTQVQSGSQQQFLTRNVDLTSWQGSNWNMVFVGEGQAPGSSWPAPPFTTVTATPRIREKPFLYLDGSGDYLVMVPALSQGTQGSSWSSGAPPGNAVSIDRFYLAHPGTDSAATLNAALVQGQHLLFTPGIYHLESAVKVSSPGTIVMGLGFATLIPDNGNPLLSIADVDGVTVAGLLLEAGPQSSPALLQVGDPASSADHSQSPTALFDVHCRIGGADVGTAARCVTIASNDVLVDNMWLWRADHGAGAAWNVNRSANGLVVDGARVTAYGLFVEHFQQYQTLWNGEDGSVYFYQSELPYDPPNQAAWQAAPGVNGYASYKVADGVTTHHAEGLGVYSVFTNPVQEDDAIQTPTASGVTMHHLVTVSLAAGAINHIINGTGGKVSQGGSMVADSSN